jgi:hypothetical protein
VCLLGRFFIFFSPEYDIFNQFIYLALFFSGGSRIFERGGADLKIKNPKLS